MEGLPPPPSNHGGWTWSINHTCKFLVRIPYIAFFPSHTHTHTHTHAHAHADTYREQRTNPNVRARNKSMSRPPPHQTIKPCAIPARFKGSSVYPALFACFLETVPRKLFKSICCLKMIQVTLAHLFTLMLRPTSHKSLSSLPSLGQYTLPTQLRGWGHHPLMSGTYARIDRVAIQKPYNSMMVNITAPDLTPIAHRSQARLVLIPTWCNTHT